MKRLILLVPLLLSACGDPNYAAPEPKTCIFPVTSSAFTVISSAQVQEVKP